MKERKFLGVLVALSMLVLQTGCAAVFHSRYSSEPIEAKVVDADTGEPLEGVIVAAHWELVHGSFGGRVPVGQVKVMEVVTDKAGIFRFPAWGPVENVTPGHLEEKSPQLLIFKRGYRYIEVSNKYDHDNSTKSSRRSSDWHGKTIRMEKFRGHLKEYYMHLDVMPLHSLIADCGWKNIPRMLIAISYQSDVFRQNGVPELYSIERYLPTNVAKCGSPQKFFKDYQS